MVTHGIADVVEVIVLAAGANGFWEVVARV